MYQLFLSPLVKWVRENIYGLFLIGSVGVIAETISNLNDRIASPVIALVFGVLLANFGVLRSWSKPSLDLASGHILKIGICLLGFRLAFSEIAEVSNDDNIV